MELRPVSERRRRHVEGAVSRLVAPPGSDGTVALPRRVAAAPLTGRASARTLQIAVAIAIVPMAASAVWLAAASDHLERPAVTALYRAYLAAAPMLIGLYWWRRRPASRFGPLLIAFGIVAWVISWQSSDWPAAFSLGVLAEAPFTILTFALFLAFPSGRLTTFADKALVVAWTVIMFGFFLPWALGSPVIAGGGPLSTCVPACPDNAFQIGSAPELVEFLGRWETYLGLVLTIVVLVVYAWRVRVASRPRRRALVAVASTSLLFVPIFFTFHFSTQILELEPATLLTMSWFVVAARILLPLGFLVALLQAELLAGSLRGKLLEELVRRPTPERWHDAVARALDDPALRLAYWDPTSGRYRQPDGEELVAPLGADRTWAEIERDGRPVGAMVIDAALAEDPELVRAAASATILAVENGNLEGELRDSRARVLAAGDAERRRIERDLHDSTQQRLVSLRIHLALASESIDSSEQRIMVEQLGSEVEDALDDLRNVARGVYPDVLRQAGVAAALRDVTQQAAIPIAIADHGLRRHRDDLELTVYFCCLEALQNAAKHAGRGAVASVDLVEVDGGVRFTVADDGVGFEPRTVTRGAGLDNLADRLAAAGGTLEITSARGRGTRVSGWLPADRVEDGATPAGTEVT
jgi:signal transduction histidine kinase